jgi:hypothetical protein
MNLLALDEPWVKPSANASKEMIPATITPSWSSVGASKSRASGMPRQALEITRITTHATPGNRVAKLHAFTCFCVRTPSMASVNGNGRVRAAMADSQKSQSLRPRNRWE